MRSQTDGQFWSAQESGCPHKINLNLQEKINCDIKKLCLPQTERQSKHSKLRSTSGAVLNHQYGHVCQYSPRSVTPKVILLDLGRIDG